MAVDCGFRVRASAVWYLSATTSTFSTLGNFCRLARGLLIESIDKTRMLEQSPRLRSLVCRCCVAAMVPYSQAE